MAAPDWRRDVDAIRNILLTQWNPIGYDVPPDEYDSYIGGIYGLLQRGATTSQLAQHLDAIESGAMGLTLNAGAKERNLAVASALLASLD